MGERDLCNNLSAQKTRMFSSGDAAMTIAGEMRGLASTRTQDRIKKQNKVYPLFSYITFVSDTLSHFRYGLKTFLLRATVYML